MSSVHKTHLPGYEEQAQAFREHLFEEEVAHVATESARRKPFRAYLRETPAEPIPSGIKVLLWVAAVVVTLLLFASLARGVGARKATSPRAVGAAATTSARGA